MAVQTRSQLEAKAATISSETTAGANTAARVGGLFDDLADSVTLNGERGLMSLFVNSPVVFATVSGSTILLDATMAEGEKLGTIFESFSYTITYTGTSTSTLRIAVLLSFAGINNREYTFYLAKNSSIIAQSACEVTTKGVHAHSAFCEAFVKADTNDEFNVYVLASVTDNIDIESLTFSAFTI